MNKALEDLQAGRTPQDPWSSPAQTVSPAERYLRAAKAALSLPILGLLLAAGTYHAMKGETAAWSRIVLVAGEGILVLLCLTSVVLAIVAMCGVAKVGSEGILGRAVSGLIISFLLLGIFSVNFYRVRQKALAMVAAKEAATKMRTEMKKELANDGSISAVNQEARLEEFKQAIQAASQNSSGTDALFAKALSAFVGRIQVEMKDYLAAAKALEETDVLDMSAVTQLDQLNTRKDLVKRFLAQNDKIAGMSRNMETFLREELEKAKVAPEARESMLKGFRKSIATRHQLEEGIRNTDQRIGAAMLGMLELLDANWGKWTWDADRQKVDFESPMALDKFIDLRDEMQAAAREQIRLQRELLSTAR